jgi:hypothetical protein
MNKLPLILILLVVLSSCGSHKSAVKAPAPVKDTVKQVSDIDLLRGKLAASMPNYKWLRSKGTVHYEKKDQKLNANITLKQRQDSLVWASVNVLIEAARGMANKDSAYILNRTAKEYMVYPVSGLEGLLGIPGIDLHALQSILMAIPPFGIADGTTLNNTGAGYFLERKGASYLEQYHIDPANLRMTDYHIEKNNSQQVTIQYSDFEAVGNMQLPKKIDLTVTSADKILITLEIADYTLLETDEAPFTIPESYTRVR